MATPYVGEIRMFGGNFAPQGWSFCNGSTLQIAEYDTLFNLIGTTYGGDGQQTFQLPNLQSRVPVHMGTNVGSNYQIGQNAGSESVTLIGNQLPVHSHTPAAATANTGINPGGNVWSPSGLNTNIFAQTASTTMNAASIGSAGGNLSHENRIPTQAISFIISLFGIYPSPQ